MHDAPTAVRLRRRSFIAAAALAAPAVRSQTGRTTDKSRLTLSVSGKASFYDLPLVIAEQLGYFRAEGLAVDVVDLLGGARARDTLLAGTADVASGAFEDTIALQVRGLAAQAFVLQGRAPQVAIGVSTRAMPDYRGLADLRGRRIGISAPGSATNLAASLMLSRAGLKPSDVQWVGVGTAAGAVNAFRGGQIDAMSNIDPVMTLLEQKGEVRIISDTRTLKGTFEVFGGPMPGACLYAPHDFVQRNPGACQAMANAMVHALKWLQTAGPGDIIKAVPEAYMLGDRALYLASFMRVREAIAVDGVIPEDGAQTALRALAAVEPGLQADEIDVSRTFTNTFARRAKEKFKV